MLWLGLLIVNMLAFVLYGIDKSRARRHRYRIPEAVLLGIAVIGGAAGALLGMFLFHHKIRKLKFAAGIPILLVLQAAAGYLCILR